ncbi:MAG: hypothetical protein Q9187_000315 [Circinaria calcarea]
MTASFPDTVADIRNGLREARTQVEVLKTHVAGQEAALIRRLEPQRNPVGVEYWALRDLVRANYQGLEDRLANLENRFVQQHYLDGVDQYRLQALQHNSNIFQLETANNLLQLRRQIASLETRLTQDQLGRLGPLSEQLQELERDVERLEQRAMVLEAQGNARRTTQLAENHAAADTAGPAFSTRPQNGAARIRPTEIAETDPTQVAGIRPIELADAPPTAVAHTRPTEAASTRPKEAPLSSSLHSAARPAFKTIVNQHPTVRVPWDRNYTEEEEENAIREIYGEDYIPNRRMPSATSPRVQLKTQKASSPTFALKEEEVEEQVRAFYAEQSSPPERISALSPQPLSTLSLNVDRTGTYKKTDLHLSRYATRTPEPTDPAVALAKFKAAAQKSSIKIRDPREAQDENKPVGGWTFDYSRYEDQDNGKDEAPIGIWSPIVAESEGPSEPFPLFDPTVGVIDGVYHPDPAFDRPMFFTAALDQGDRSSPPRSFGTVGQLEQSMTSADHSTEWDNMQPDMHRDLQKTAEPLDHQKEFCKRILERVDVIGERWRSERIEESDERETWTTGSREPPVGTRILGSLLDAQSKALVIRDENQRLRDIPALRLASTLCKTETVYVNEAVIGLLSGHATTYIGDLFHSPFLNATITIHLTIDSSGIPSIVLVGHMYDTGARSSFMFEEGREVSYRKYSLRFSIPDCLVPASLELGTVPDVMLLPAFVATSLGDPNEIPENLRYISFYFKDRIATGFEPSLMPSTLDMGIKDAMSADAVKFFKFLCSIATQQEGKVRMWFLAKGGEVDIMFTKMRSVCARGLPKIWKDHSLIWKAKEVDGRVFWHL